MLATAMILIMCGITFAVLPMILKALINLIVYCAVFISALWSLTFLSVVVADKLGYLDIIPPFIGNIFVQIITLGGAI